MGIPALQWGKQPRNPIPRLVRPPILKCTRWRLALVVARIPCYYGIMIRSFKNAGTEDIFNGKNTKAARQACPQNLWRVAVRRLDQLDSVTSLAELRIPPGNRLEALAGDRKGQYSIRINEQYWICFAWADPEPDQVEIVDYH
jgi:proteic killer suppression protein